MFGWLKNKVSDISKGSAAEALRDEFAPIEKLPGAESRLAERLTNFVLTGDGESAMAELAALKNTHLALAFTSPHQQLHKDKGLANLITRIPQEPDLVLRLAKVYAAAEQAGQGVGYVYGAPKIPAFDGALSWLGTFLIEISQHGKHRDAVMPAGFVMAMIEASGENPEVLVRGPFFYEDAQGKNQFNYFTAPPYPCFHCLDHFADLVASLPDIVRPAFRQKEAGSRATVLRALLSLKIPAALFAEEITALAVSGSKEVRENAVLLISENFATFKELLERHATKGSADERFHAVRLLSRSGGEGEREFLTERLQNEKSEKVRELLREALADQAAEQSAPDADDLQLPPVPEVEVIAPLDKSLLPPMREMIQGLEDSLARQFSRNQAAQQYGWTRTPVAPDAAERLFEALQTFVVKHDDLQQYFKRSQVDVMLVQGYPMPEQFQLIHVVRWCLLLSGQPVDPSGNVEPWQLTYRWSRPLLEYQKNQNKQLDLRELAAVFRAIGLDDLSIGRSILQNDWFFYSLFAGSDINVTWPYFAERPELLEEALGIKPVEVQRAHYSEQIERRNAFRILQAQGRLPARFITGLWEIALGSSKTDRRQAQEALDKVADKEQKIVAALASRQQDARLAAAQWLAVLKFKDAIPALRSALAKEKSDVVRDELIKALESLGVPLEELLDLKQLDQEAERGLKKGIPSDLDWFPFSQLPSVAWSDTGQPVPSAIIQWFLVQGCRLKNAEASPALRRYCSLFQKEDREKLGKFVLEAWIASDTKPRYTADQAAAEAQKIAQQTAAYARQYPQYYPDFNEQRVYQSQFNWLVIQPEGSQTSTKGILAVTGACGGGDAAPIVHRYIKQWYGHRAAQCKALLQVLAWIEHPSATQVVLSVANRFRTKGIQEEAMRLCELLAERKGWTMDELSDRTIPTAGFDEVGVMELDYGTRKFTASLSAEMSIGLTNQSGKTIASLPDANQSDDADKVKQSKAALANARKELKSVLSMQKDRLYEALCTQRTWRFEDWDTYLRQHPIVGRYCQRLIWVAYENESVVASFRPLADGSLTNNEDDAVTLTPETAVRLAHEETLPAEDAAAWLQHFSDYEVEPLFQQFGKQRFTLPDALKEKMEVKDFLGHIVKAFSLRNRLTRLGYTRGEPQDGGWFFEYRKTFLRLGIEAIIEFTGNGLPEENRTVALQRLYFSRKHKERPIAFKNELPLGEIPPVLLTECWNDIRMAAADGTGFAEDWQKQTEV